MFHPYQPIHAFLITPLSVGFGADLLVNVRLSFVRPVVLWEKNSGTPPRKSNMVPKNGWFVDVFFSLFQGGIFSFHHNFSEVFFRGGRIEFLGGAGGAMGEEKMGRRVGASKNSPEKMVNDSISTWSSLTFFCHCFSDFFWKGATSPSHFCKNKNKQGFSTQVWRMSTNASWKGQTSPYPLKESKKQEQHGHLRSKSTSLRLQGRRMGDER